MQAFLLFINNSVCNSSDKEKRQKNRVMKYGIVTEMVSERQKGKGWDYKLWIRGLLPTVNYLKLYYTVWSNPCLHLSGKVSRIPGVSRVRKGNKLLGHREGKQQSNRPQQYFSVMACDERSAFGGRPFPQSQRPGCGLSHTAWELHLSTTAFPSGSVTRDEQKTGLMVPWNTLWLSPLLWRSLSTPDFPLS